MPLACTLLRTLPEWEAFIPEWTALWATSPGATPFQHPAWLLPWWGAFAQEKLLVAVVRRAGKLIGLLPLYVYPDPSSQERQLLPVGAGTSDYLDGVFASNCEAWEIREALALVAEEGGWDCAHFAQLRSPSPLLAALRAMEGTAIRAGEPCGRRPAASIAELPPKLRAEVRYQQNAARALGKLRFEHALEGDWEFAFEMLVRMHTERWRLAGEPGVMADPAVLAHHRAALPGLLRRGMARLNLLWAGEHLLGVLYSLVDPPELRGRTQYLYLMGYAPEYIRLRPGTLLLAYAVEKAAQAGFAAVDMLRGEESYKKFWRLEPVPTFCCSFPKRSAQAI